MTRMFELDQNAVPASMRKPYGTWESTGIIDVSDIYGKGSWFTDKNGRRMWYHENQLETSPTF